MLPSGGLLSECPIHLNPLSPVICKALQIWSLELVPFLRQCPEAELARENPAGQKAFICHYQHHWFTIRKIGSQWFNLNSMLPAPRLISETYLTTYLAQLKEEGNSIFFIIGTLPECEADQVISVSLQIFSYFLTLFETSFFLNVTHTRFNSFPYIIYRGYIRRCFLNSELWFKFSNCQLGLPQTLGYILAQTLFIDRFKRSVNVIFMSRLYNMFRIGRVRYPFHTINGF
ncbi:unnamed protein product [Trichobilharzia regenti]|nr:unnamed protein product [Trichobilharzia regenti]